MYSFKCQFNWLVWCWYPIFEEHIFEIKIFLQNSARKLCRIYALLNIRKLFNINCLLGILPFIALSYMNLHIFLQIRQSRQVIILKYYLLNYRRHLQPIFSTYRPFLSDCSQVKKLSCRDCTGQLEASHLFQMHSWSSHTLPYLYIVYAWWIFGDKRFIVIADPERPSEWQEAEWGQPGRDPALHRSDAHPV